MNEEALNEIAGELHSLNANMLELISVLKEKKEPPRSKYHDEIDALTEAMRAHDLQLENKRTEATPNKLEAETKYQKDQEKLDNILRNLGLM
jgi:hypothetical protein